MQGNLPGPGGLALADLVGGLAIGTDRSQRKACNIVQATASWYNVTSIDDGLDLSKHNSANLPEPNNDKIGRPS